MLNISAVIKAPLLLYDFILKSFSKKTSEILKPLLTIYRVSLEEISNINKKMPKTKYHTFNIFNSF